MGKKNKNSVLMKKAAEAINSINNKLKNEDMDEDPINEEINFTNNEDQNSDLEALSDNDVEENNHCNELNKENNNTINELKNNIENKFNNKILSAYNNNIAATFLERMTIISKNSIEKNLNINDDIKRELLFNNIANESAIEGILRLKEYKQKINRPDDYMAEMLKSDEQMVKIKREILDNENRIKRFQLREEKMLNKKFNKKTKSSKNKENEEYKKTSKAAIEHWKKSIKENPNEYYKLDDYVNKTIRNKKKMSRKDRNIKFNPKLSHKEKFKKVNTVRNDKKAVSKKSGFNKSQRAPKFIKKRQGKNKRMSMKNKNK